MLYALFRLNYFTTMKLIYLIPLLFLSATFVSCDGDDDPNPRTQSGTLPPSETDNAAPAVTINVPAANDSVLVIDVIAVAADITDNRELDNVRVILADPGGATRVLSDVPITYFDDFKNYKLSQQHQIPKYAATGNYTVTVEAKDKGLNVTKDSVTFILHASDINSAAFSNPFSVGLIRSRISEALGWYGYSAWDSGYTFSEHWFNIFMYLLVTTDSEYSISKAEWDKFMADFDVKNQSWENWDENSDGNLNDAEFNKGLNSLNFYNDWDKDQDKILSYEELSDGFFDRWDLNNDDLLSREEYQEKFYTYLYRE